MYSNVASLTKTPEAKGVTSYYFQTQAAVKMQTSKRSLSIGVGFVLSQKLQASGGFDSSDFFPYHSMNASASTVLFSMLHIIVQVRVIL